MTVVCAWCKTHMSGPVPAVCLVSHGMCAPCAAKMRGSIDCAPPPARPTYLGACEADCGTDIHSFDVGAIVYTSLGYGCVCEGCARLPANATLLSTSVGPIVRNPHAGSARWQPWTVLNDGSPAHEREATLRARRAAGTLGAYADSTEVL